MKLTILGQCPAKKNSKQLFLRDGKPMMVSSRAYLEWEAAALWQLKAYRGRAGGKVTIDYKFYVKDRRRRDLDNMIASVNDVLIKAGLLEDDDWAHLEISGASASLDRPNPRAEIDIEPQKDPE